MERECFFRTLRNSVFGLDNAFNHYLHRWNMNGTSFKVLYELYCVPEGLEPAVLADRTGTVRPAVTVILNSLEEQGYLIRKIRPGDRRKRIAALTPQGVQFAGEVIACCLQMEKEVFDSFPAEELFQMLSTFTALSERLRERLLSRKAGDPES